MSGEAAASRHTTERPTAQLRVVICDDGVLTRECLARSLRSEGIDADCAWDLPSVFRQLDRGIPDVIVLNIDTPDSSTLIQVASDFGPGIRVIVIGLSEDREADIVSCAEAGVAGLHLRTESFDDLLSLIRSDTDDDQPACSPAISAILLRRVYALIGQADPDSLTLLTEREDQILRLLDEGLSNQQIASRLHITFHTVKNHVHSLFGKLGVSSRGEAVAAYRAIRASKIGSR